VLVAGSIEPFLSSGRTAQQVTTTQLTHMLSPARAKIELVSDDRPTRDAFVVPLRAADAAPPPVLKVVPARPEAVEEPGPSQTDDEALVAAALGGKRWAEREIWYRFAPMVYGLLRRSLNSRHDHDDLAQEVFLRVFRRLHTLEKTSALRSFIYSVAVRVVCEEIRHFRVLQRARSELALNAEEGGGPTADLEARDTLMRIERLLDGMKEKHRAVFVLRHVEGMDLREISDGLGISLATVKRYLVRSLRVIQHWMAQDETLRARLGSAKRPPGDS
jgi:RNA polymerase sigma-70 factor, ECF subfamily